MLRCAEWLGPLCAFSLRRAVGLHLGGTQHGHTAAFGASGRRTGNRGGEGRRRPEAGSAQRGSGALPALWGHSHHPGHGGRPAAGGIPPGGAGTAQVQRPCRPGPQRRDHSAGELPGRRHARRLRRHPDVPGIRAGRHLCRRHQCLHHTFMHHHHASAHYPLSAVTLLERTQLMKYKKSARLLSGALFLFPVTAGCAPALPGHPRR